MKDELPAEAVSNSNSNSNSGAGGREAGARVQGPGAGGSVSAASPRRGWFGLALYLPLLVLGGWALMRHEQEVPLSRFVSSLRGRTPNQVHNVALAARSINGKWIRPGEVFSFNRTLGPWSSDSGYRLAPVSYDGELVPSWGGGVCQASTTLYNAALLAGLTVVERHRHRWAAHYADPGRDAAVAYPNVDLRLRNDLPWPVRLEGQIRGELVEFRVVGPHPAPERCEIRQRMLSVTDPAVLRQPWRAGLPVRSVRNPGKRGYRVVTYRLRYRGGVETARELLSDDDYPSMNRLLLTDNASTTP